MGRIDKCIKSILPHFPWRLTAPRAVFLRLLFAANEIDRNSVHWGKERNSALRTIDTWNNTKRRDTKTIRNSSLSHTFLFPFYVLIFSLESLLSNTMGTVDVGSWMLAISKSRDFHVQFTLRCLIDSACKRPIQHFCFKVNCG